MDLHHLRLLCLAGSLSLVLGCGGGGGATSSLQPPTSLSYSTNSAIYTMGVPIPPNIPSSSGGMVSSYYVIPALPVGLTLNGTNGIITGEPLVISTTANFTVFATNKAGTTSKTLSITVNDSPPSIGYGSDRFDFYTEVPLTNLTPANTGGTVVNWSIDRSLPAGLSFNPANGQITGTPSAIANTAIYTITATNSGGTCIALLTISVNQGLPSITSFTISTASIISGDKITLTPIFTGGTGTIIPDIGSVTSGDVITIYPGTSMKYTLFVDNNPASEASMDVFVQVTAPLSAELYDPSTKQWALAGNMSAYRQFHTATLTPNGQVLVVGGSNWGVSVGTSCELYDPSSDTWSITNPTLIPHYRHSAILLTNGKILIAGGYLATGPAGGANPITELYDPITKKWSLGGSMAFAREIFPLIALPDGRVLAIGGQAISGFNAAWLSSVEIYDPNTNIWTTAESMAYERTGCSAVLLPSGKVLVTGGIGLNLSTQIGGTLSSAEIFDPITGHWTSASPMSRPRSSHVSFVLNDGRVLVAEGYDDNGDPNGGGIPGAEIYDPITDTWSSTGSLAIGGYGGGALQLFDGSVLIAGGTLVSNYLNRAEQYDPNLGSWTALSSMNMNQYRSMLTATQLVNGKVLISGGNQTNPGH